MKPSARRGFALFIIGVVGVPITYQIGAWLQDYEESNGDSPWAILFIGPALLVPMLPAWRGWISNGSPNFWDRTPSGQALLILFYCFLVFMMLLVGVITTLTGKLGGPITVSSCVAISGWWALSGFVTWRSADARCFFRARQALHRLSRIRRIVEVNRSVERLRDDWHNGILADGISIKLPSMPDVNDDGEVVCRPPMGTHWATHHWKIVMTLAHYDHIWAVRLHPFRCPEVMWVDSPIETLGPVPLSAGQAAMLSAWATSLIPRWYRPWMLGRLRGESHRVSLEAEFSTSEWLMVVWREGIDSGTEWHRLDVPIAAW